MDERLFHKLAQEVADDFQMGGLTGCVYEDYAKEILARYLAAEQQLQSYKLALGPIEREWDTPEEDEAWAHL